MISEEELLADIIANKITITIDHLDPTGGHFIFFKEYGGVEICNIFEADLTKIYHTLLGNYYIECTNSRYAKSKDKEKNKILNYKMHKFLSYYKEPKYNILKQSNTIQLRDFAFRLDRVEFYFKDKDGLIINFATINLLVLICSGKSYYLPASKDNVLIQYLCKGEDICQITY